MNNDPNQPQSSSSGQQPPVQSEQSQEPSWYESPPQWGQQPPPQYQPSPYGQLPYEVSPIPDYRTPQQPQKHSRRWLWITLCIIGGLVALGIWDRSQNVVGSLAVDTQGNLYVIENSSYSEHAPIQLEKFSPTGKTISIWKGLCIG